MGKKKAIKSKGNKVAKARPAKAAKTAKAKAAAPKKASAKKATKAPTSGKAKSVKKVAKTKVLVKKAVKAIKTTPKGKKTAQKMAVKKAAVKQVKKLAKPAVSIKKTVKNGSNTKNKPVKEDKINKSRMAEGIEVNKRKSEKTAGKAKKGKKQKKGDDDEEPIIEVDDILLAEIISAAKPPKKKTKEVKQLRTFVNPMASLTVAKIAGTDSKKKAPVKELKGKFELEYVIGTSPAILYEFLTTPSGLSEWFADDVNIHDGVFTFLWEGSEQKALLLDFKEEKYIRFRWLDKPEGSYFEFRIQIDELTGDVSLMVTDFADEGSDLQTSKLLWDSQIHSLMNVIGSY